MQADTMDIETVLTLPVLAPRPSDSNKATFGRVLIVGGSAGMSGAAVLCASAALRAGAGLVTLATPQYIWSIVAAANPCYLTMPLPDDDDGRLSSGAEPWVLELADTQDVVAIGPGLGRSEALTSLVSNVLAHVQIPVVLDADGLNALQQHPERLHTHKGPLILTPHPGELSRLTRLDVASVQARRTESATRFASECGAVVVLKGQGTIVTDGKRVYVNTTGNPGMATGGTGDVLAGMIAALVGQGLAPFEAAQLGVHVHGLAGDLARDEVGEVSLIATDLLDYLPKAFRKF